jgi:CRP-like cAMP-binding protein
MGPRAAVKKTRDFAPHAFLDTIGEGRKIVSFPKKQTIFAQGDPADAVFFIQTGKVRLTVVSNDGKEATIGPRVERSAREVLMLQILRYVWSSDEGQDIAEYAVMLAVILVLVIGTVRLIGGNANNAFSSVASNLQ